MEKKSKKEFHQLSEDQLQEVTGGGGLMPLGIQNLICKVDISNPCPSGKFDSQCKCIE